MTLRKALRRCGPDGGTITRGYGGRVAVRLDPTSLTYPMFSAEDALVDDWQVVGSSDSCAHRWKSDGSSRRECRECGYVNWMDVTGRWAVGSSDEPAPCEHVWLLDGEGWKCKHCGASRPGADFPRFSDKGGEGDDQAQVNADLAGAVSLHEQRLSALERSDARVRERVTALEVFADASGIEGGSGAGKIRSLEARLTALELEQARHRTYGGARPATLLSNVPFGKHRNEPQPAPSVDPVEVGSAATSAGEWGSTLEKKQKTITHEEIERNRDSLAGGPCTHKYRYRAGPDAGTCVLCGAHLTTTDPEKS